LNNLSISSPVCSGSVVPAAIAALSLSIAAHDILLENRYYIISYALCGFQH